MAGTSREVSILQELVWHLKKKTPVVRNMEGFYF